VISNDRIAAESIEREFPDWEPFRGVDCRWDARIRGSATPVMVHDDDLEGLREEILRANSKDHELSWARRTVL
jgi:hypothetical protein